MALQKYDELPFLHQLTLRNLIQTNDGLRCSCPICNEGSHPNKRRCNILTKKYSWVQVTCFNCNLSTNLKEFIRLVDPLVFASYQKAEKEQFLKDLRDGKINQKQKTLETFEVTNTVLQYQFNLNTKYFKPAKLHKEAVEFCKERKIIDNIDGLYYNVNIKSVLGGMIIFPFLLEDNKTLYGFMGRHTKRKNFHVFTKNDSFKSYGVFQVDKSKPIIVVESIIDSLNIENSIAMVGADLTSGVTQYLSGCDLIFGFDNDKTGILKTIKYSEQGHKCFIWPSYISTKDFNDLVKAGWSCQQITKLIKENTYQGLELKTRLVFKQLEKRK